MKTRLSLSVACALALGVCAATNAATTSDVSSAKPARVKHVEKSLRASGLVQHYPTVVRVFNDNEALVASYAKRTLTDKELKILALKIAKTVVSHNNKVTIIKVRLYDPASIKYWSDVIVKASDISGGLGSGSSQDKALTSVKIVDNPGLVDGPNLETRIALYKRILRLQRKSIEVGTFMTKFMEIEAAERAKENVDSQMADLQNQVAAQENAKNTAAGSPDSSTVDSMKAAWQQASADEEAARKALEDAEDEMQEFNIPESSDNYPENREIELRAKINAAIDTWSKAEQNRNLAYEALQEAMRQNP